MVCTTIGVIMEHICRNCQNPFHPTAGTRGVFCSLQCYWTYLRSDNGYYHKQKFVQLTCDLCGKPFRRRAVEAKRSEKHYCSQQCAGRVNGAKSIGKSLASITLICGFCHREFKTKASNRTVRFCSRQCNSDWRAINFVGPNNPNYKHGKSQVSAVHIALQNHPARCMICGFDIAIEIHHITAKSNGGNNDMHNLAVLCPNHHAMAKRNLISAETLQELVDKSLATQSHRPPSAR